MGFAAGLQAGTAMADRALNIYRQAKQQQEFERIQNATPEELQGALTADQQAQLDQAAASGYEVIPQTNSKGLITGYGYAGPANAPEAGGFVSPAPGGTKFLGQTVQGELTPERMQGLRYRAMADVVAAQDPAKAMQMRAEATRMEREAEEYPLRLEALQTQVKAGKLGLTKTEQDIESGSLTLGQQKRTEAEQLNASNFSAFAAENPNLTTAELKDAAFKQFKFTPKQWQDAVNTRLNISDTEQKIFVSGIKDKLKGKNLQQLGALYNTDPDFDDKTDLAIVPGKNGAVTLNFIDKATNKITGTQTFKNESLATEYLNKQATEPENIGSWMLALRKTESGIEAQGAATEASRATVGLRNAQIGQIREGGKNAAERADIVDKFEALTPEEQAGRWQYGMWRWPRCSCLLPLRPRHHRRSLPLKRRSYPSQRSG